MKRLIIAAALCAAMTTSALAGKNWTNYDFQVEPQNAAKVVSSTDQFMKSSIGKEFPGKLILLENMGNGSDPTTHSYVVLYKSVADAEKWNAKADASEAWAAYMNALGPIIRPASDARYALLSRWGAPNDATTIWQLHMIRAGNPGAVVAALTKWHNSEKGKQFPGEGYLSAPIAAGQTKVTHVISVGFKSMADMEAWNDSLQGNADWDAFMREISGVSEYLGATMSREVKEWGKPMKDMVQ